jgi:predicted metalloendopeptidase
MRIKLLAFAAILLTACGESPDSTRGKSDGPAAAAPDSGAPTTDPGKRKPETPDSGNSNTLLASGIKLENLDTSVRPQDDFYQYVNGAWLKNTEIPANRSSYNPFVIVDDKVVDDVRAIIEEFGKVGDAEPGSDQQLVGDFHKSFIDVTRLNELGTKPIAAELARIEALSANDDLAEYIASTTRAGTSVPFGFFVDVDVKAATKYTVYFYQSGITLPDRSFYLDDDERMQTIRKEYTAYIIKLLGLAGLAGGEAAASTVMSIETKIAEAHWTQVDLRDAEKTYNKHDIAQLKALAPSFNWAKYLKAAGLEAAQDFVVGPPSFFQKLDKLLADVPLADWKVYLRWRLLNYRAQFLTTELETAHFAFHYALLQGVPQQEERGRLAVYIVDAFLGPVVGKAYVERHFRPEAKARTLAMVENVSKAFRESIKALDWMSEETKGRALEKLQKLRTKIGFPDKWRDYSAVTITPDDLVGNIVRVSQADFDREVAKLGKPIDREEWFALPHTVNAYYDPSRNEIVFPAGILQPPFFDPNVDDAINYGAIGSVIGHELGHAFDDQGARYDGDGVLRDWWTEKDLAEFKKRTTELVKQYSAYEVLPGKFINGELTLGENIGDLGGLSVAHQAYVMSLNGKTPPVLDGFSGSQRVFIGQAQVWASKYRDEDLLNRLIEDPHSPGKFRTNGVVRNMPEFVETFELKEGDKLFLPSAERVKIW